ncbi:MAG: MarR family transcriptional regulator [Eubacteriales bacterium]|nr:MarR family transcriptional regulator [Eubacteriales bacterium]MDY3332884.1 MarR family transcriptional regulator [Gallibacter sp.]
MKEYPQLKLSNQLCFPLYAVSKEIVRAYTPLLKPLDLTYTQYIVMMALWEVKRATVSELGKMLYLDSGTLTPVLKKMEKKGLLARERDTIDERRLFVSLTSEGEAMQEKAADIPALMSECFDISEDDAKTLHNLLQKVLKTF